MFFKTLVTVGLMLIWAVPFNAAENMAVMNERGRWYDVQSDYYRCTFYEGCMYPVWFYSADGKVEYPRGFLLDWIKQSNAPDIQIHYLRKDHFAEVKIIENTCDKLIVECTGKFCNNTVRFPGVTAIYRYTLKRNSPEIILDGTIVNLEPEKTLNCRIYLGVMAFNKQPFSSIEVSEQTPEPFRVAGKAPQSFKSATSLKLITGDGLVLGVNGPAEAWNNSLNRYYTYIGKASEKSERFWDGKRDMKFQVKFIFQRRLQTTLKH